MNRMLVLPAALVACGLMGCNRIDEAPVDAPVYVNQANKAAAPVKYASPPAVLPGERFTSGSYDAQMSKLRADIEALGADQLYEEYYYDKLRETPAWGLDVAAAAPSFVLKDASGKEISLDELRTSDQPVMIYFYRGGWSPTSSTQLKWLATAYPHLQQSGVQVVAVTPEQTKYIQKTVTENEVPFPVLSDTGGAVAQSYRVGYQPDGKLTTQLQTHGIDLAERYGAGPPWLPVNSVFLLDRTGNVVWRSVDTGRGMGINFGGVLTEIDRMQSVAPVRAQESQATERAAQGEQAADRAADGERAADRADSSNASNRSEGSKASER